LDEETAIDLIDNQKAYLAALFLFIGAMGKSAQFPFHTWLADAMAGPTPVSALLHAATMVAAGVYLLIRVGEFFEPVYPIVAFVGSFVALFAATMAIANNDLKKIIAFSTLSQLGYMFAAIGLKAPIIAFFHLFTHAFFKALLFMGAGNVMHAANDELDIRKMGGFFKSLPITAIFMIIGSLSLSGIFPLSGFFSKDLILEVSFEENKIAWLTLLVSAFLTAFYSFRLIFVVFFGEEKKGFHLHEASLIALLSMFPLAILAIIAGVLAII